MYFIYLLIYTYLFYYNLIQRSRLIRFDWCIEKEKKACRYLWALNVLNDFLKVRILLRTASQWGAADAEI